MLLHVKSVCKAFNQANKKTGHQVLDGVSFKLSNNESISITGPSGSGKTTLLNLIGLIDKPDSGEIFFNNDNIVGYKAKKQLEYRNQHIGFVFQQHHLLPQLNLLDNILVPTIPARTPANKSHHKAKELMEYLGIWQLREQKPGRVSVGECQRAAICRALINDPGLLLADEPSGSLDKKNADMLGELLKKINRERGLAMIVVTHSDDFARKMQKTYKLELGKLHTVKS